MSIDCGIYVRGCNDQAIGRDVLRCRQVADQLAWRVRYLYEDLISPSGESVRAPGRDLLREHLQHGVLKALVVSSMALTRHGCAAWYDFYGMCQQARVRLAWPGFGGDIRHPAWVDFASGNDGSETWAELEVRVGTARRYLYEQPTRALVRNRVEAGS